MDIMLNQQQIYLQWPRIKQKILKHWDKLDPQEIDQTNGTITEIIKLIQKNYGAVEDFEEDFEDICFFFEKRFQQTC